MTLPLQSALLSAVIIYFLLVYNLLKHKKIALKYSLIWLLGGVVLILMIAFPKGVNMLMKFIGIEMPINGLLGGFIFWILIYLMSMTSIITNMNEKHKKLIQQCALLEKRVRDLEEKEKIHENI